MIKTFKRFVACEDGISSVEYALLAAILGVGLVTSIALLGNDVSDQYAVMGDEVKERTTQNIAADQ